eukprot:CCRYP_002249-RB/>CCRYP_002249-RB protein AED:0.13 eAED:0.13 QI:185/1/1/1/0.83/0.71/7/3037/1190
MGAPPPSDDSVSCHPLLLQIILSPKDDDHFSLHHLPLTAAVASLSTPELLLQLQALDRYRRSCDNLYARVRCLLFLYAVHRFHLPERRRALLKRRQMNVQTRSLCEKERQSEIICPKGYAALLDRRFEEAIDHFLAYVAVDPDSICDFYENDDGDLLESPDDVIPKRTKLVSDLTFDPTRKSATVKLRANGAASPSLTKEYSSRYSSLSLNQEPIVQKLQSKQDSTLILPSEAASSSLATTYRSLAFQTLADQVKSSVKNHPGNEWMFGVQNVNGQILRFHEELVDQCRSDQPRVLLERTPVRMDLSHSCWSDIFFLGMDFPEGARVINCSVNLAVKTKGSDTSRPIPPIECRLFLSTTHPGTIKLTSIDLHSSVILTHVSQVFKYAADYLGLLKAGLVASGIVPLGLEKCCEVEDIPIKELLAEMFQGEECQYGLELVTNVHNIPKGSRLAVSTNLLGSIIAVCMRATKQTVSLTGSLLEEERRLVAARAILGEWLGGSGGGWQDSGGVWPGLKLIHGVKSKLGDPEYGISRGRLLPDHHLLNEVEAPPSLLHALEKSLVLLHGGMAQNVGPILEMVTEKYLLREEEEWCARHRAMEILDELLVAFRNCDVKKIAKLVTENFFGPIRTVVPWATNSYTETLIEKVQARFGDGFWGFWMLGGMSGGGMGFIFDPDIKDKASSVLGDIMIETKRQMESYIPFAMDPVVFDYTVNDVGTVAELYRCDNQNDSTKPSTQSPTSEGKHPSLSDLLRDQGFDIELQEEIRSDLRKGIIGLANNRLPPDSDISDVTVDDVVIVDENSISQDIRSRGLEALTSGTVGIVTLAAGVGSRWTQGAGVVKALHPYCSIGGKHRNFIDFHLAKNHKVSRDVGMSIPHVFTTSWMTHEPINDYVRKNGVGPVYVSKGSSIGLRIIPMVRDLRFFFEEQKQQKLDEQEQKVQDSLHAALIDWAESNGEGSDYTLNVPKQCLCPVGHWYEVPNLFLNGTLARMLRERPQLKILMLHNIDTVGATVDPNILGLFLSSGSTLAYEVVPRCIEDIGGGLYRVNGKPRLVEGLALPREEDGLKSSYYNSLTTWIDIDGLLTQFGLDRSDILEGSEKKIRDAVHQFSRQLPTYVTIKDVKKRWGNGQEDVHPVAQFEKLWGDMSSINGIKCSYFVVSRCRGQQLKDPAQLDGWSRDGGAQYLASICDWT